MENLFKKKCFEPEPAPDEASAILDNPQVAKLVRDAVLDFCERSGINAEIFIESAKIMPGLGKLPSSLNTSGTLFSGCATKYKPFGWARLPKSKA